MAPERVLEPQNLSEGTKIHIFRSKITQNPSKNNIFETSVPWDGLLSWYFFPGLGRFSETFTEEEK